jgi:hypothetical protein
MDALPPKAEVTLQIVYENVNRFINQLSVDEKEERCKELHDELEVDIAAYCEHKLNMKHIKRETASIIYSKEARQQYNPLWLIMCMKI